MNTKEQALQRDIFKKDFKEGKKANACKYHFMLDMFVLHLSVS